MNVTINGGEHQTLAANDIIFKVCKLCGEEKPLAEFHMRAKAKDGRQSVCKTCACARAREWGAANREHVLASHKIYYHANKERINAQNEVWAAQNKKKMLEYGRKCWAKHSAQRAETKRKYRAANKEKIRSHFLKYHAARPGLRNTWDAERRAAELRALPEWVDKAAIKAIYQAAKERTGETGMPHHVDHIVPLKHKLVCGLHVPQNLRIIPYVDNLRKSNRFIPT